jgi:hypothetical protein
MFYRSPLDDQTVARKLNMSSFGGIDLGLRASDIFKQSELQIPNIAKQFAVNMSGLAKQGGGVSWIDNIGRTHVSLFADLNSIGNRTLTLLDEIGSSVKGLQLTNFPNVDIFAHLNDVSQYNTGICREIQEYVKIGEALKVAGWLPHDAIPIQLVREFLDSDPSELCTALDEHFAENWPETETLLRRRFEDAGLDNEALAVMDQALRAHEVGLYLLVCPAVSPQIERVAGQRYYGPDRKGSITSLKEVREGLLELTVSQLRPFKLWQVLAVHKMVDESFYAHVRFDGKLANDETIFPNRHVIAHGRRSFPAARDSLNALFVADFMFCVVDALVKHQNKVAG